MRNFIFKTLLTPETFRNGNKIKRHKTLKNSQVPQRKIQQKSLKTNQNQEKKNTLVETFCKDTMPTSLNLNLHKPSKEILSTYKNRRIFYNNFSHIIAVHSTNWRTYKVIKLGYYPSVSKFTRKKNIAYQIPDEYEVETNLAGLLIRCKTQY
ncbi:hypothetical protein F8M41_006031 [Gigaspora margarita]|uniref:Uncharacterized protein n=1 Tax=Gigaspora margarita TaxID=4874 RepID=A0A8H4ERF1_GIGMA|nr:hypothetical protein F8M41_006031 [Gigaspora margarita]